MQIVRNVTSGMLRVAKHRPAELSREAKQRLNWIEFYERHRQNVSLTCRRFGISRPTFYRWLKRYDPQGLSSLEDRSSAPKRRRKPNWREEEVAAVKKIREKYPCWGKDKLVVLLKKTISIAKIGRILKHLKSTGQLKEPLRGYISTRKRITKRSYGIRKPKGYEANEPGDIVQVDTLDVRPVPGVIFKHFTGRDVVSKWDVLGIRSRSTARTARDFLVELIERAPFPVKAVQVDGGSEFMAEFEEACRDKEILLFVLPPRSPKLNGCVERAQRTHTEEFYELSCADPTLSAMTAELREWERTYNEIRPHQALKYLTPLEYIENWKQQQARKEAV